MLDAIMFIMVLMLVYLLGYLTGRAHERDVAGEQERLAARIDPPNRTAGIPTNTSMEPSEVRQPRWRNGQFRAGPDQDPRGGA